jgi:H+-transporting ATPase
MTPIGWKWAAVVIGYCLVWFLIEDRMKLAGHRIFDKTQPGLLTKQ